MLKNPLNDLVEMDFSMIPVLCVESESVYKNLGFDAYDLERNAFTWPGGGPAIYHPPCRNFSRLRKFSKGGPIENSLALRCVSKLRLYGGVLEHPASSTLFKDYIGFPLVPDKFGGFFLSINQYWFGHPCEKKTWLYIVGLTPSELPPYPLNFNAIEFTISSSRREFITGKREVNQKWRSKTPIAFALWLSEIIFKIRSKA